MSRLLTITALMMSMSLMTGMAQAADPAPKIGQQGDAVKDLRTAIEQTAAFFTKTEVNQLSQGR